MSLVVRVLSFFSLPDGGPKSWQQGRTLPTQVVDMHSFSLLQLVNFIAEHYMWGSKQYITLWRALEDKISGDSAEIKTDEQLLEWFKLNKDKGKVYINAQINDFEGPLQFSPTKRRCHPSVRNRVPTNETRTDEIPTSTKKKRSTKKQRATKTKAKGEYDDDGVGVEEDGIHSDTDSLVAASDSSYDSDLAASSDSCDDCSDPEFNPDGEVVVDDDEYDPPPFSYDVDNPNIDVNVVFPDVDQCKAAVTHHAILNDHAFKIKQKDQTRFRAFVHEYFSIERFISKISREVRMDDLHPCFSFHF
jgi:hypothetical protein